VICRQRGRCVSERAGYGCSSSQPPREGGIRLGSNPKDSLRTRFLSCASRKRTAHPVVHELTTRLSGQIRHHSIEHRKSGLRNAQPPIGLDRDRAFLAQERDAPRVERATGQRGVTLGVDALGKPQPHQQKFIGALVAREHIVGDDAMTVGFDAHQPRLGALFGRNRASRALDIEPAMRAGADAGIFVAAPIDQIVPALRAFARMVGDLVGRQAVTAADLLRDVVERTRKQLIRRLQLACGVQAEERRALLDGQLVKP